MKAVERAGVERHGLQHLSSCGQENAVEDRDIGCDGAVIEQVDRLLESWPTAAVAGEAWREHGSVAVVADDAEAITLADEYAPEHLEVQVEPHRLGHYLDNLRNYGSLFLGDQATVVYGDKAVGINHVLPTMGAARYTGGL